jgi:hypothetical protein
MQEVILRSSVLLSKNSEEVVAKHNDSTICCVDIKEYNETGEINLWLKF